MSWRLPGEIRFRVRESVDVAVEAVQFARAREHWRREDLAKRLLPHSAALLATQNALRRGDWAGAAATLRSHFTARQPLFPIHPANRGAISAAARQAFPFSADDALRRAASLLESRYDLLGYRDLSFRNGGAEIDWHFDPVHGRRAPARFWARVPYLNPQVGDHKIIWELNRHQHWLALGRAAWLTGDTIYADKFAGELESWLVSNPPLTGINWASMLELAFRSISWIWAVHFFTAFDIDSRPAWLVDLLLGLDRQLGHVARHLSVYFSPNTHLLGEGLALYVAGRVLPELSSAARWEQIGRRILMRESRAQVLPDGGHVELSAHYHRYALDFYLLALVVARWTRDAAAERFADVAFRLASFCRALADDEGRLPAIGDDDGGLLFPICDRRPDDASDSLSLAAALLARPDLAVGAPREEVFWMLGGNPAALVWPDTRAMPGSQLLPDSGYLVLRCPAAHAVLDAGPHGFLNGGHAHADALSFVLSVHGQPLLIDPGTATYTMDRELRDRFRSTAMHNTVVVDGRPQSTPAGPFHWASRADGHVDHCRCGFPVAAASPAGEPVGAAAEAPRCPGFDYAETRHDGYLPLVHRRVVLSVPDGLWLVVDHVLGTGEHRADAHWHVHPAWTRLAAAPWETGLAHPEGVWAAIASTALDRQEFHGDTEGLGWCAPVYGKIVPSLTLRFSHRSQAPFSVVTAIAAAQSPVRLSLEAIAVDANPADRWHRVAVRVTRTGDSVVALFATAAGEEVPGARSPQRILLGDAELTTDARAAVLQFTQSGEPSSLALVEGTRAAWTGRNSFNIVPLGAAQDVQFDLTALRRLSRTADLGSQG